VDDATRAILGIANGILGILDREAVLARVLTAARELTGARYAAIGVSDESRTELVHFEALGIDARTRRRIGSRPPGRGEPGELISDPVPLRLADVVADPRAYGFPEGHPPIQTFLGVPIVVNGEPFGNLYVADKVDGAEFDAADEDAVLVLAGFAGIAIDHARRFASSEAQRAELQRSVAALDAMIRIAQALGGHTDARAILDLVCERGRELVSARALVIEIERNGALEVAAGSGERTDALIGSVLPLEDTVAAVALATRRSQRLTGSNRARFERHGLGVLGMAAAEGLVVPMVFRNEAYGVIVALDALDGGVFTAAHQGLLESFAASAASALATARLAAVEQRRQSVAAAEAERTRWARELHDETLQGLASQRLLLASAQRRGGDSITEAVDRALGQLDIDIAGLRALIAELRPPALDELGTEAAVAALAERFRRNDLQVDLIIELARERGRTSERHVPELETAIYRIVQEALTNASRHGHARHATVEIAERAEAVRVSVRDDGAGFDSSVASDGFGLAGMQERAELLGGSLSIESAPGGPTTLTAMLPVRLRGDTG
jgi:signal transduction histidine kinase